MGDLFNDKKLIAVKHEDINYSHTKPIGIYVITNDVITFQAKQFLLNKCESEKIAISFID